jgi:hypothetical protein
LSQTARTARGRASCCFRHRPACPSACC